MRLLIPYGASIVWNNNSEIVTRQIEIHGLIELGPNIRVIMIQNLILGTVEK